MRDGLGVFRGRLSLLSGRLIQQPIQQRGSPRCRSHGGGDRTQPLSGRAHPPGWPRSSTLRSMHGECLRQPLTVRGEYEAELRDWPRSGLRGERLVAGGLTWTPSVATASNPRRPSASLGIIATRPLGISAASTAPKPTSPRLRWTDQCRRNRRGWAR